VKKVRPEDVVEELRKAGINPEHWVDMDEKMVRPMALDEQRRLLMKLRNMLEGIVEQDRQKVLNLREQIIRLQHGGGS